MTVRDSSSEPHEESCAVDRSCEDTGCGCSSTARNHAPVANPTGLESGRRAAGQADQVNPRKALARGGFVAAACMACCAPPIIAALGLTAGLAATAGVFLGLAAAVAVLLGGGAWIAARSRVGQKTSPRGASVAGPQATGSALGTNQGSRGDEGSRYRGSRSLTGSYRS